MSNIAKTLLADVDNVKSRTDGSVHTLHGRDGSTTLAELCVGKRTARFNVREPLAAAMVKRHDVAASLGGRSKSWRGGGIVVTDGNVAAVRALLLDVIAASPEAAADEAPATDEAPAPAA